MEQQMDYLYVEGQAVIFKSAEGKEIAMPNLTKLVEMYRETEDEAVRERIKAIFNEPIGRLCVVEIMVDMTNEKTLERLRTGEISKTMGHVHTYNVILESNVACAKKIFQEKMPEDQFESICFAQFPYGIVIEEKNFPGYENTENVNKINLDIIVQN